MGIFRRASAVGLISLAVAGVGFACSSFRGEGEPSGPETDGAVGTDTGTSVWPDGSSLLDAGPDTGHAGPCGHWLCESFDEANGVVNSQLVASLSEGATLRTQALSVSPPRSLPRSPIRRMAGVTLNTA